jgi:hypothetical protein
MSCMGHRLFGEEYCERGYNSFLFDDWHRLTPHSAFLPARVSSEFLNCSICHSIASVLDF